MAALATLTRPRRAGKAGATRPATAAAMARPRRVDAGSIIRAVRRMAGVIRPLGWTVIGCGLVALALGSWLGWAEARYLGVGLLALAALAALFVIGRSPYAVQLFLTRARVKRGERAYGRIEVRNTSSRATMPASLELPVGQGSATFALPRLAGGGEHENAFQVPTERRAVLDIGPVRSVRGDALGLMRREVSWTEPQQLFVHPDTVHLGAGTSGVLRDLEGLPTRDLSSSDVAFHALRDYVPGDDMRHIAWAALAKTGRLMVRQFEETRRSHIALLLSLRSEDYGADEDEFELAVSVCASLALQAIGEEKNLTVITGQRRIGVQSGPRVLDALSGVETEPGAASMTQLATSAAKQAPGASMAAFIVGSNPPPSAVHAAAARLPIDARRFAIRCQVGAEASRASVGETTVVTIGALAQLPGALFAVGA